MITKCCMNCRNEGDCNYEDGEKCSLHFHKFFDPKKDLVVEERWNIKEMKYGDFDDYRNLLGNITLTILVIFGIIFGTMILIKFGMFAN